MFRKAKRVLLDPVVAANRILLNPGENGEIEATEYYEFSEFRFAVVNDVLVTFERKYPGT